MDLDSVMRALARATAICTDLINGVDQRKDVSGSTTTRDAMRGVPYAVLVCIRSAVIRQPGLASGFQGAGTDLKETTPVLSLLGTHCDQEGWNDLRSSHEHISR
jgi:hypothetical protein